VCVSGGAQRRGDDARGAFGCGGARHGIGGAGEDEPRAEPRDDEVRCGEDTHALARPRGEAAEQPEATEAAVVLHVCGEVRGATAMRTPVSATATCGVRGVCGVCGVCGMRGVCGVRGV